MSNNEILSLYQRILKHHYNQGSSDTYPQPNDNIFPDPLIITEHGSEIDITEAKPKDYLSTNNQIYFFISGIEYDPTSQNHTYKLFQLGKRNIGSSKLISKTLRDILEDDVPIKVFRLTNSNPHTPQPDFRRNQ